MALRLADIFFNHSVSCLAILDLDYNFVHVNEAYARACRRNSDEFVGRNHFDLYPSDAKPIFDDVVRRKRPYVAYAHPFEFSDQPNRGMTYWDWTLAPALDDNDKVEYLVFSLVDVTERVRAEEALHIAALVYQHSSEAMLIMDASNKIIATNDAFTLLTNYSAKELVGKGLDLFDADHQWTGLYATMLGALNTAGHWKGEARCRTKKGESLTLQLTINTVFDDTGKVKQRIALLNDITEAKRAQEQIWEHANFDALTGLPNRRLFYERLAQHLAAAKDGGRELAILLIDLDQFKEVNETLGHEKGDMLLAQAAHRITTCVRQQSTLARVGGDEFALILSESADVERAGDIAKHINCSLVGPFHLEMETIFVSASVGITIFPKDGAEVEELIRHADQAMYAAKHAGRNRYYYYNSGLQEAAHMRMRLLNDMRAAISRAEFELHYQPIVELDTGRISKAEALIRWPHITRGMVSPVEFIPVAETSGLILEIGEWIFKTVTGQLRQFLEKDPFRVQISVNVSPVQFHNDGELHKRWLSHLAALGMPPQSVVFEITEGLLLHLSPEVKEKFHAFRDAGMQISLDDFGTGYSSLAYLQKLNLDYLKIDRAFINNLNAGTTDCALCDAIVMMAHKLGMKVIAEGVETAAQRDLLVAAGCDYAQGYFFSKPVPAKEFDALLKASA